MALVERLLLLSLVSPVLQDLAEAAVRFVLPYLDYKRLILLQLLLPASLVPSHLLLGFQEVLRFLRRDFRRAVGLLPDSIPPLEDRAGVGCL